MGDRVLFLVVRGADEFDPGVYCHWTAVRAPEATHKLAERMKERRGDIGYASARLVQECTAADPDGAPSFGVSNAPAQLTAEDSHGDAGVVLIDCNTFKCECLGGYLVTGADGFPEYAT